MTPVVLPPSRYRSKCSVPTDRASGRRIVAPLITADVILGTKTDSAPSVRSPSGSARVALSTMLMVAGCVTTDAHSRYSPEYIRSATPASLNRNRSNSPSSSLSVSNSAAVNVAYSNSAAGPAEPPPPSPTTEKAYTPPASGTAWLVCSVSASNRKFLFVMPFTVTRYRTALSAGDQVSTPSAALYATSPG